MGQQQAISLLQENLQQEQQTAQKLEQLTPQLLRTAMQQSGGMGTQNMQSGQTTVRQGQGTTGQVAGTTGGLTGDDYVKVDTSKASDILIDETQNQDAVRNQRS